MLMFAFDQLTRDEAWTRVDARPNCQVAVAGVPTPRYSCFTLLPLTMLDPQRLRCERTERLLRAGRPFVYPLELRYPLRATLTAESELVPGFPAAVAAQVRAGRAAILIWIAHEAVPLHLDDAGKSWLFDIVQALIRQHELPPAHVWLVSGNMLATTQFATWLRERQLYEEEAFRLRTLMMSSTTVRLQYRLNERGIQLVGSTEDDVWTVSHATLDAASFAEQYVQPGEIAAERATGRIRPKRFLSMNRLVRLHRQVIVSYLEGKNLLDDSLVSFAAAPLELNDGCAFPIREDFLKESWRRLQPKLPLTIDDIEEAVNFNFHRVARGWPYRDAYFNIVTETDIGRWVAPVATEKQMKPMLNYQPYIAVTTVHTLRYLRAVGFKTFEPFIDSGYDAISDPAERMQAIFGQIDRLGQLGPAAARDLYFDCLPVLEHNRAHLLEGRHEVDALFDDIEAQIA
jgi:hypothetical protein